MTGQILKIMAAKPDAVLVGGAGTPAALPQMALREKGYKGLIYQTHGVANNDFLRVGGKALEGTTGTTAYTPDLDNPRNKAFVAAWKAKFNRLPTDNEGQAYNGATIMFEGVKKAGSVKPADVAKALSGATLDTIYGTLVMRAADNQLGLPNFVGRAKVVDGVLRPVIEQTFAPSLMPVASPLCKL